MSKGADLAQELGIECKQALYSSWGNFYGAITDFPCVLFDAKGFVIVTSKDNLHIHGRPHLAKPIFSMMTTHGVDCSHTFGL